MPELLIGLGFLAMALSFLVLTLTVSRIANRTLPSKAPVPVDPILADPMPQVLRRLIDLESESWARQDLELEARQMYLKMDRDWERVHAHLVLRVGQVDPEEATDRAWQAEPVAVQSDGSPIEEGF